MFNLMKYLFVILFSLITNAHAFNLIIPSAVASGIDSSVRYFVPALERELKEPVQVFNYPGADGLIGLRKFNQMDTKCDTMLVTGQVIPQIAATNNALEFDPITAYYPIHGFTKTSILLVTNNPKLNKLEDLVFQYKNAEKLTAGAPSTQTEIIIGNLDKLLGVKTDIAKYTQPSQLGIDLSNNLVDFSIAGINAPWSNTLLDAGKLKAISKFDSTVLPEYPELKSLKQEKGKAAFDFYFWSAFFVKQSESPACKQKLYTAINRVLTSEFAKTYTSKGVSLLLNNPQEVTKLIDADYKFFKSGKD